MRKGWRKIQSADDFMANVGKWFTVEPGGCWLWMRSRDREGYGNLHFDGRLQKAHRVAYELLVGPITGGLTIDHLCRVPGCVNPAHMEPVDIKTNLLRGNGVGARFARATHCVRGHEFSAENTLIYLGKYRICRRCGRERMRTRRAAHREASRDLLQYSMPE